MAKITQVTNGMAGSTARANINGAMASVEVNAAEFSGDGNTGTALNLVDAGVKASYEANADTNAFTDAEQTKLAGIETGATADQTGAEIKAAYEGEANTNAFTDAEQTKLAGIEAGADVTDAANVTAAGAAMLAGQSGGQTLNGGTGVGEDMVINSTSNATKGELNVDGIAFKQGLLNGITTGLLTGGELTINANTALFDIADGEGYVIDNHTDPSNPTYTKVTWSGLTGQTVTNLATSPRSNIAINSAGAVVQQTTAFSTDQLRTLILLGRLVHTDNAAISITVMTPCTAFNTSLEATDISNAIGPINKAGNVFSAAGANLNLTKSAGETFRIGSNYANSKQNPSITTDPVAATVNFAYRYQDGVGGYTQAAFGTTVNPNNYDDGSGTLAAVASNRFSVQRIYYFGATNSTFVMYGQAIYNTLAEAEGSLFTESFSADPNLASDATFRGWLVVRGGTTDLSDATRVKFVEADKFGSTAVAGATSSTTSLQQAYNNSDQPEILTNATQGAVDFRRGSGADSDNVLTVQNNAGTINFSVTGEGNTGIGQAVPQRSLHVENDSSSVLARFKSDNTFGAGFELHNADTGADNWSIFATASGNTGGAGGLAFFKQTGNTGGAGEKIRIDGDGNLGIGQAAPEGKLHVETAATTNAIIESTGAGASDYAQITVKSNASGLGAIWKNPTAQTGYGGAGSMNVGTFGAENLSFVTNNASRMTIDTAGNIGVGVTPSSKLTVGGGTNSIASGLSFEDGDTGIYEGSANQLRFIFGNNIRMLVNSSILASTGSSNTYYMPHGFTPTAAGPAYSFKDDTDTGMYTSGADTVNFATGGTERLRIKSDGVINIANAPTYADDTAAGVGGLVAGDVYKTAAGDLKIKL